ncbi:hypothetical protein V496_05277 [Pseudogymnoascus sp. VKM F-4515 (FW-2607)]|nr:hypothetical protein V496_05277 [Pseudogymnoascus sp. VKM F-4515 (FW-2607)]
MGNPARMPLGQQATNGDSMGTDPGAFEPPPSTLAAKLVNKLSGNQKPFLQGSQDSFGLLVSEVSKFDKTRNEHTTTEEITENNYRVIYVLTKARLGAVCSDESDPFAKKERVLDDAAQVLDLFITSIKETPEILTKVGTQNDLVRTGRGVPLWIWLWPRLLRLLGNEGCEQLWPKVKELFHTTFDLSRVLDVEFWGVGLQFLSYLRHCADASLHNVAAISTSTITLPLATIEEDISFPSQLGFIENGCTYNLHGGSDSFHHTQQLLALVADLSLSSFVEGQLYESTSRRYMAWVFDSFLELRTAAARSAAYKTEQDEMYSCSISVDVVHRLVSSHGQHIDAPAHRKGYRVLSHLCSELLAYSTPFSDVIDPVKLAAILLDLASACEASGSVSQSVAINLLPVLDKSILLGTQTIEPGDADLKSCILLLRQKCQNIHPQSTPIALENKALELQFQSLRFKDLPSVDNDNDGGPQTKRRKIAPRSLLEEITEEAYMLLGAQKATDLDGLSHIAADCFSHLEDTNRCKALKLLGMIPCASAGTLTVFRGRNGEFGEPECTLCGSSSKTEPIIDAANGHACPAPIAASLPVNTVQTDPKTNPGAQTADMAKVETQAVAILSALLKVADFDLSRKPRILAMMVVRKFALHFEGTQFMDLESSVLGQWCLTSLRSSVRELRIVAGRTVPAFLRDGNNVDVEVTRRNRVNAINILRQFSGETAPHLAETWVLTWGQIARVSKDRELNLTLLRLVEYLGHTNQIVSGLAFTEILSTAEAHGIPVGQMFSPFWRTIAHTAVSDLQNRPQTVQLMAELLSISVPEFLVETQAYTLPWLVLAKKTDIITKISQAREDDDPSKAIISNMVAIMPLLLVQAVPNIETFIMGLLRGVSPAFDKIDLVQCLGIGAIEVAVELLKNAGDEDDSKKSRVRHALNILATHCDIIPSDGEQRKDKIGAFLEQYSLGIMSHFSELVNDTRIWQSPNEKKRSLRGIEELVKVGKSHTRSALPQIHACLQSALSNDHLRTAAFQAWGTMIRSFDDEEVSVMLETTFAIIIQHWQLFDTSTREYARKLIEYLLTKRFQTLGVNADLLPSLAQIPELQSCEERLVKMRSKPDVKQEYQIFSRRISHEHASVVTQGLTELATYLKKNQEFLQASAVSEQPEKVVGELLRAILDACVQFNDSNRDVARLAGECLGMIGCVDSNRVETVRKRKEIVVLSNFDGSADTTDFVLFILQEVLVKAFASATNPRAQGFFSYAMQELLRRCDFSVVVSQYRSHQIDTGDAEKLHKKWLGLPESVQMTLSPFLSSKYTVTAMATNPVQYPIFQSTKSYNVWLRAFVLDLLQKPHNANASLIFDPLSRVIRIQDTSVANFLLPYTVLHSVALGSDQDRGDILGEILAILEHDTSTDSHNELNNVKLCSEAIFRVLDYLARWAQEEKATLSLLSTRSNADTEDKSRRHLRLELVGKLLSAIPAQIISRRAVECKSYARALFHWEAHIRKVRTKNEPIPKSMLLRLQDIYTQIDEPDGIEGISAHLYVLDIDQQVLGHRKAGRWTAAQSWYEIKLAENPSDTEAQVNLLDCMKESGQYDALLNYVEGIEQSSSIVPKVLPFATEASWATSRWNMLEKYVAKAPVEIAGDFNVNIGRILLAFRDRDFNVFDAAIKSLREHIASSLSADTTSSLGSCHDSMLRLHVLTELDMIAHSSDDASQRQQVLFSLDRRLEVVGAYLNDKQYLLSLRRAAMQLSRNTFTEANIASAWLTSARIARKGNSVHHSFNAVLHASKLGDDSAMIEHARLIWREGHHRKAIQSLQGAIDNNAFISHNQAPSELETGQEGNRDQQNLLAARAHLLLAKWQDDAGQTHSTALRSQYQFAAKLSMTWERGHYYLGRHYNKLLESEKTMASEQQILSYLAGEMARLVIENYLRSLSYGTKYVYQTLPRILTLWLDLGMQITQPVDAKYGTKEFAATLKSKQKEQIASIHLRFDKYIQKMPAYMFYTALPQIVARIAHPNQEVYQYLHQIIVKVVSTHPQQALWTLLAVTTSTQTERKTRGASILQTLFSSSKKLSPAGVDLKSMIQKGQRLSQQLLVACTAGDFPTNRTTFVSITKHLGFNPKHCCPSPLAVPIESALTATLPTLADSVGSHKAFSRDVITIDGFADEVMVLSSLQRPRKLTTRGSDGKLYGLLCKPKDDLRKDQRLMEFNSMINRSLKRDAEASKRQLYIKTYAVTPLNEECGIIEWVDGLKTLRDILLGFYKSIGVAPNYTELRILLKDANDNDDRLFLFKDKILAQLPPVFHHWFVQQFPEPSSWFAARLKYTRSCAVMSMVGTILGLGDRHGENILFEEGNGGTFHVDFNCLFDKGLTFQQPEKVPFRLTHNMVDAMGVYGYEGPFRTSSEISLRLLRQHEETLMTILEAFVYDPTLDLLESKNKKRRERDSSQKVPNTPQGVLKSIRRKMRGLLEGDSVPLGVEGQVDELIKQATIPLRREIMAAVRPELALPIVRDVGLTVLRDPPNSIADIVFVHGLQGHPRRTWTCKVQSKPPVATSEGSLVPKNSLRKGFRALLSHRGSSTENKNPPIVSEVFWPLDLLPEDCGDARILTWGYESNISRFFAGPANQNTIFAHARDLLYALENTRRDCKTRSLIFVTHSLGGIIVKDVLCRAANEQDDSLLHILKATKAVLFLERHIVVAVNIQALQVNSPELEVVHERFMKLYQCHPRPFEVYTFQEAQGLTGVGILGLGEKGSRRRVVYIYRSRTLPND